MCRESVQKSRRGEFVRSVVKRQSDLGSVLRAFPEDAFEDLGPQSFEGGGMPKVTQKLIRI
jgi:hypothetical protein